LAAARSDDPRRMGAWIRTAAGHGRMPPHVRWPRRIAGLLATATLLAIGVAIALMVMPSSGTTPSPPARPAATPTATPAAKKHAHKALTAAQRRARSAAVAAMRTQGYVPVRLRDWNPRHELRVLLGYRSGDATGPRRAFFFAGGHLVGTDSSLPSSNLTVSGSGGRWVTLSYGVYTPGDHACCPSGGRTKVRYEWSGSAVSPVGGTIPAASERVVTP
jgi:LppP/LprE lipoprotein